MTHLQLLNKRIVVTRAEEQSENITSMLRKIGAIVLLVPTIKIVPSDMLSRRRAVHRFILRI